MIFLEERGAIPWFFYQSLDNIRIFIDGIVVRLLRGLINLKVLMPDTDFIYGIWVSKELKTTMKSSQFQASLK